MTLHDVRLYYGRAKDASKGMRTFLNAARLASTLAEGTLALLVWVFQHRLDSNA